MEDEIEQLRKQELLKLSVNNYTKQMDAIRVDMQDQMVLMGSIVLIILVFCFVALTANIFRFIKEHKREFAIHQMCGARRKSICVRILIPVWSMYFIMCAIVLPAGGIQRQYGSVFWVWHVILWESVSFHTFTCEKIPSVECFKIH